MNILPLGANAVLAGMKLREMAKSRQMSHCAGIYAVHPKYGGECMDKKVVSIIAAAAVVLGLFMPMAAGNEMFVNLGHLSGLPKMLYLLGPAVLVLAIMRKAKPFEADHFWLMGVAAVTVVVTIIAAMGGISTIETVASMNKPLADLMAKVNKTAPVEISASIGFGALLVIVGSSLSAGFAFLDNKQASAKQPTA